MKNLITTNQNPKAFSLINNLIETEHAKGLAIAKNDGSQHKINGLPLIPEITIDYLTGSIKVHYNNTLAKINTILDGKSQKTLGATEKASTNDENKKLTEQQLNEKQEYEFLNLNVSKKQVRQVLITFITGLLITLLMIMGEWLFLARSLQMVAGNFFSAMILGLAVTIGIVVIGYFGNKWIVTKVKNQLGRRIARTFLILIVASVFIYLGHLRSQFFQQSDKVDISPIVFFGLNTFLFIAIFFITELWILPQWELAKDAWSNHKAYKEVIAKKKKIELLEKQIQNNSQVLKQSLSERYDKIVAHRNYENEVKLQFREAISVYKKLAICFNPEDGSIPICLKDEPSGLDSYTSDLLNE